MQKPHLFKGFDQELNILISKLNQMGDECELQLTKAVDALTSVDRDLAAYIMKRDELINAMHREVEQQILAFISKREPKASDLRVVLSGYKIGSELERIGDYAANIAKHVMHLDQIQRDDLTEYIILMARTAVIMISTCMESLNEQDIEKAHTVWHMDDKIDANYARLLKFTRQTMEDTPEMIANCTTLNFMGRCCERIGDHITNIAEDIYFMKTGDTYIENACQF